MKWILSIVNMIADRVLVDKTEKIFWERIKAADSLGSNWDTIEKAMDDCWDIGQMVTAVTWVVTDKRQEQRLWDLYQISYEMHRDLKGGLNGTAEDWNYNEEECPF